MIMVNFFFFFVSNWGERGTCSENSAFFGGVGVGLRSLSPSPPEYASDFLENLTSFPKKACIHYCISVNVSILTKLTGLYQQVQVDRMIQVRRDPEQPFVKNMDILLH